MPENFTIQDMGHLHRPLYSSEGLGVPPFALFLDGELAVRNYIISMLSSINFKYHSAIRDDLLFIVKFSIAYDVRTQMTDYQKLWTGDDNSQKWIVQGFESFGGYTDLSLHAQLTEYTGQGLNLMDPYIKLYFMMKEQKKFIEDYGQLVGNFD